MNKNPNFEFRIPKEIRSPKTEPPKAFNRPRAFDFWLGEWDHSDFGFRASFGFREFGLRI
jgi:hypothetical protein